MNAQAWVASVAAGISFIGILAALSGTWFQLRRQWLLNSATTVTTFETRFVTQEWKEYRVNCASLITAHHAHANATLAEDFQVLGLFEHLALLVRRGAIDYEMVWNKFGWYIIRYFEGLTTGPTDLIEQIRAEEGDETLWEEFEWIYRKTVREYEKRGVKIGASGVAERVAQLVRQESTLLQYKRHNEVRLLELSARDRVRDFATKWLPEAFQRSPGKTVAE